MSGHTIFCDDWLIFVDSITAVVRTKSGCDIFLKDTPALKRVQATVRFEHLRKLLTGSSGHCSINHTTGKMTHHDEEGK